MRSLRVSGILFVGLSVGFLAYLIFSVPGLPERVASHFDWHGHPNGWMPRPTYLLMFGLMGLGLPLLVAGLFFALRFFPLRTISIPRRDYWLAPERRAQTFDFLARQGLWLACLLVALLTAVHYLVVRANSSIPVTLPSGIWVILVAYVILMLLWLGRFFVHFARGERSAVATSRPTCC